MELFSVISAKETATPGVLELVIDAEIEGVRDLYPFGYSPYDEHGLGPAVREYLKANPIMPAPYTPPPPPPKPDPVEELAAFLRANPEVAALLSQK